MGMENAIMLVSGPEYMGVERIREALFKAGYRVAAVETANVKETLAGHRPALIVANLAGLPAADLELCQALKRLSPAPIIAIGSGADEAFRVGLLELLVDDYLSRPVNPRELVARVRSILRRTRPGEPSSPVNLPAAQPEPKKRWLDPLISRVSPAFLGRRSERRTKRDPGAPPNLPAGK
jgi:two-component system, OmpR family, response regulator ResD